MKKLLLAAVALSTVTLSANAQTRMTIHEEFTGENCPPCATTNPPFWALCNSTSPVDNPSKLIHIAYMAPIPSSGWYYMRNQVTNDARRSYYGVTSAPSGKYDGNATGSGHPASFTQAHIDAEAAIPSPFNITVTSAWNSTYDGVVTTVNVTCVTAFSTTGTNFKLRAALCQTDHFDAPPGTNGESHFENVVQAMYPNAAGTTLPASWAVGETHSYTITGTVPSYVEKDEAPFMVVWLQDDVDKNIKQAGKATPLPPVPNDAAVTAVTGSNLTCVPNGPYTVSHSVTLKNSGSTTLTSADIYYRVGTGALTSIPWTGSLATGATITVPMPTVSVTVSGSTYVAIYDSVANPNGVADMSVMNNTKGKAIFLQSTNAAAMPYSTSYESADVAKFYRSDDDNDGNAWGVYTGSATFGKTGTNAAGFECFSYPVGETEIITLPNVAYTSSSALTFWTAYRQYASENDRLEVVYSTNCGTSWTSIWSAAGAGLATGAATTSAFGPTSAEYVQKTVSLSSVPAGAMFAFRATSAYGNNMWVDNVNIATVSSVNEIAGANLAMSVFPNPTKDNAVLSFNLAAQTNVTVAVVDGLGRIVSVVTNGSMGAGNHEVAINTANLASGVYNVMVTTDAGTETQRLSVVK